MVDAIAAEARDLVRQAAGSVTGKTVAAQIQQAARNLGYPAEDWRVREAWYGRAGSWSATAVDDLRRRSAARQEREAAITAERASRLDAGDPHGRGDLVRKVSTIRDGLAHVQRQVSELDDEISRLLPLSARPA